MYLKSQNLNNKTALVTGAGKGIGKACAIALAEAGADVIIISRTKKDLDSVQDTILKFRKKCNVIVCDVSNYLEVKELFLKIKKLDILVNNAGTNRPEHFTKVKKQDMDYIVDLNKKIISYKNETGLTQDGIKRMTEFSMKDSKGESEQEIRMRYSTPHISHRVTDILSTHSFIQTINLSPSNKKGENSTSYLISYKLRGLDDDERFRTLYIPKNGSAIISEYNQTINPDRGEGSWLTMKFGKCVQTSD